MFNALLYLGLATTIPNTDYEGQTMIDGSVKNCNIDDRTKAESELEMVEQNYYKEYSSVVINDKNISLMKPVVFLVNQTTDGVYFTNTDLNIYSGGENFEIAEQNMYEELLIQWDIYAKEKDSNMTEEAIKVKNNLRSVINLDA